MPSRLGQPIIGCSHYSLDRIRPRKKTKSKNRASEIGCELPPESFHRGALNGAVIPHCRQFWAAFRGRKRLTSSEPNWCVSEPLDAGNLSLVKKSKRGFDGYFGPHFFDPASSARAWTPIVFVTSRAPLQVQACGEVARLKLQSLPCSIPSQKCGAVAATGPQA